MGPQVFSVIPNAREKWISRLLAEGVITTPSLVIDSDEIDRMLGLFYKYLPEAKLYYAVKANNSAPLLAYLRTKDVSFDVASTKEIQECRAQGISPSRMLFSNPIKSKDAQTQIFSNELRLAVVDNPYDLASMHQAGVRSGKNLEKTGILVRLRIPTTDVQINLNEKFGCTEEEAIELLRMASEMGFSARGLQFHVGTQSWNVFNYRAGVETVLRVIDQVNQKYKIVCDTINIGGGFPDPNVAKEAGGYETFFSSLRDVLQPVKERGLNIIAEPGRIIISGASSAVCTVIGKNVRNGTPWLYLDDGAYGLFSGKFFDHKEFQLHPLRETSRSKTSRLSPYVISGPTCDSIDVVSNHAHLPSDIEPGEILCAHNMGAYSVVTAGRFNGFGEYTIFLGSSSAKPSVQEIEIQSSVPTKKVAF